MRSINQGMSSRVKNNAEYANTRLNNSEFRNAAQVSQAIGVCIVPKYRPMLLTFSQAKLTKSVLELIRQNSGDWGTRNLVAAQVAMLCDAITQLSKRRYSDLFGDVTMSAGELANTTAAGFTITGDQSTALLSLGIEGVDFKVTGVNLLAGVYNGALGRNFASLSLLGESQVTDEELDGTPDRFGIDNVDIPVFVNPNYNELKIAIVIAMPYRLVNGIKYTLQEYCAFIAKPAVLPA